QENITLHSTVIPSKLQRNAALMFLQRIRSTSEQEVKDYDDNDDGTRQEYEELVRGVALLVESNTGFGRTQYKTSQEKWPLSCPYPIHISRLQAAYAQKRLETERRLNRGDALLTQKPEERSVRPNPDTIPSFDDATTTSLNARVVEAITTTIRENRVRYV